MTLDDYKEAENELLNEIAEIRRNLEAADSGKAGGFNIDVNIAKTNAGQIISGLQQKFNTYKQKANELI